MNVRTTHSGDTLAMVVIYLRNLLLNQSVIVGLLATLLLVPRAILVLIEYLLSLPGSSRLCI